MTYYYNKRLKMQVFMIKSLALLFPLLFVTPALAIDATGLVVRVSDGDTLTIRTDKERTFKVRLYGIDAPEKGQPYGKASSDNLKTLCAEQTAQIDVMSADRYGRLVGVVTCQDINANLDQLNKGLVWAYRQYLSGDEADVYISAETTAKETKSGLWKEPNQIAPWEWRRR